MNSQLPARADLFNKSDVAGIEEDESASDEADLFSLRDVAADVVEKMSQQITR